METILFATGTMRTIVAIPVARIAPTSFPGSSPTLRVGEDPGNKVGIAQILSLPLLHLEFRPSLHKSLAPQLSILSVSIFFATSPTAATQRLYGNQAQGNRTASCVVLVN